MSDVRENLKRYLNTRVEVRGTFVKWDDYWKTGIRQTGRACIAHPEIDSEVVCPYVWAIDAPNWKKHRSETGSQVVFDAAVRKYIDRSGKTNYCLACPSAPIFLNEPPALRIPELPTENEPVDVVQEPDLKESPAAQPEEPLDRIRKVKAFAKTCGSFDTAITIVEALPTMPLPALLTYLNVLKE